MKKLVPFKDVKIGLLGGSFNPAHQGHLNISLQTLKKFGLSKIFWLVTPCNPTKNLSIYQELSKRVHQCKQLTLQYSSKIIVIDIEKNFRNCYSSNTIQLMKQLHNNLYWIIGCDNIINMHLWYKWKKIFKLANVIVCERTLMALKLNGVKAINNFHTLHVYNDSLVENSNFYIFHTKKINISSTEIRNAN